uniref:NAD(P)(+)--arginine ADP-ribosyltransferase n=1 Tax=Erpetoichthys calabaricus TaxID=27687 RepID=A0A8C4SYS9_ERPCA
MKKNSSEHTTRQTLKQTGSTVGGDHTGCHSCQLRTGNSPYQLPHHLLMAPPNRITCHVMKLISSPTGFLNMTVSSVDSNGLHKEYWKSKTFPSGVDKEVLLAVTAYTSNSCYAKFNEAVESGVFTVTSGHYRSMHFLLTMAMENFKVKACVTSYRGVKVEMRPKVGEAFRFGRFASSSRSRAVAEAFGKTTVFIITTCYGMDITQYSLFPLENEVLIHPYEEFEVTAVNNSEVTLLSRKTTINYRCAPLSGKLCRSCLLSKSLCEDSTDSRLFSNPPRLGSSANLTSILFLLISKSFILIKNSSSLSTDPCWTPLLTSANSDKVPCTVTLYFLVFANSVPI